MAKPTTVVLVPVWGFGHFKPMLEVGKRLLTRSGRRQLTITVVIMPAPTPNVASEIDAHMRAEEAADPAVRVPFVAPPTDHTGPEEFVSRYVQAYAPHVEAAVSGLTLTSPVAAVVFDLFCTPLLDATRALGVPAYVYMITSAAMCALLLRAPGLDEEVIEGEFEEEVDVPGLPPVPPSCLPSGLENRKVPTYNWFVYTGRRYMETSGIVINTVAELEPRVLAAIADGRCTRGVRAPPVYTIGPVIPLTPHPTAAAEEEEEHECVRWLDAQPQGSVVFLCFGGSGFFPAPQAHEIARALERGGHRFLCVLRGPPEPPSKTPTDGDLDALLPPGFLERTNGTGLVWPRWAPQQEILANPAVGGFVTHGGWNSVLESLWHGVPMIPWPLGAEQPLITFELVACMGVAVELKTCAGRGDSVQVEATELERACRKAAEEGGSYAAMQKLAHDMLHANTTLYTIYVHTRLLIPLTGPPEDYWVPHHRMPPRYIGVGVAVRANYVEAAELERSGLMGGVEKADEMKAVSKNQEGRGEGRIAYAARHVQKAAHE
ncbi:hypothetical protein PR202_gb20897 [Eleusine coracana subsp. coracana]|uniref:Glycosyltransferase n=1 Tax=Eleusine coracana subsp. coracana TaxID=191504 RepID=A0AAV5FBV0_ELECO|nr:hypothetical protein QOZ80_7BG0599790 [Eleusine coracana subsp. coracana]GJN32390.1 hypothetical protein PR202_gb20897 [Eleusine coracana subsp. coracana]